jgi:hypothetical protein
MKTIIVVEWTPQEKAVAKLQTQYTGKWSELSRKTLIYYLV